LIQNLENGVFLCTEVQTGIYTLTKWWAGPFLTPTQSNTMVNYVSGGWRWGLWAATLTRATARTPPPAINGLGIQRKATSCSLSTQATWGWIPYNQARLLQPYT